MSAASREIAHLRVLKRSRDFSVGGGGGKIAAATAEIRVIGALSL